MVSHYYKFKCKIPQPFQKSEHQRVDVLSLFRGQNCLFRGSPPPTSPHTNTFTLDTYIANTIKCCGKKAPSNYIETPT